MNDPRETLALVDRYESWMDGTCLTLSENDEILRFIPGKHLNYTEKHTYYKTVNIYKFSRHFSSTFYVPFLEAYSKALGNNEYYEQVLRTITMLEHPHIKAKRLTGETWYEIDDIQDLDIAESLFGENDETSLEKLQERYGGYWRYPKLLDFCYLVNPYFPPQQLIEEMKANFTTLLTQYPSGMKVNSLLAAKNFNVSPDQIVIGNGAAELIKSLMSILRGKTGFIRPTFEEYPNRYGSEESIDFIPDNEDFSYSAQNLIDYFTGKGIAHLVVVNPDNPSGNYIGKQDLLRLVEWAGTEHIQLVIDESFVDFADEADSTLIQKDLLSDNPHLFVMKSISKSYGIPGIRLGILTSGNQEVISHLKKDVSIWNINSFGEFYMQIAERYTGDYQESLIHIRAERTRFLKELQGIQDIRVIPSQANYVMVEILTDRSARALTRSLLIRHNIFVKDLSGKIPGRQLLRLAVRNTEDNNRLIEGLRKELR